jgi:hypothetical protein
MSGLARTKLRPDEREVRWVMGPSRSCCRPLSRSGASGGRHTRLRWNRARVRPTRSAADDNKARQYAMAAVWLDPGGSIAHIIGGL